MSVSDIFSLLDCWKLCRVRQLKFSRVTSQSEYIFCDVTYWSATVLYIWFKKYEVVVCLEDDPRLAHTNQGVMF